ncbi:S1C family serine protease [Sulfitobacter sp. M368]|uniref:S1C family serine protease n=1 Tax=Sulfitobacter sp. M368 TaxID=2867021 RepID=UPI0021A9552A|nr:serine protease [Sulfitobacter sp. M368]UWR13615.1 serine protease [Sulfitobacter sp. M368]
MSKVIKLLIILCVFVVTLPIGAAKAQNYEALFRNFSTNGLTYTERRFLQAALAFEGHYVGLFDGDWGRMSREAMQRYTVNEFGSQPEEWHTAMLALSFFERYQRDGWDMRYFPVLKMSLMLPLKTLIVDAPTEHLLNYRHRNSTLAVSVGRHSVATASNLHRYTMNAHSTTETPYSVRKDNIAISTATTRDGTKLYTRSNYIDGGWSTIMVSAKSWDLNTLQAVSSSIAKGNSAPLDITKGGKLIEVVKKTVAFSTSADQTDIEPPRTSIKPDRKRGSGSGFVVSDRGHVLTNAHVVEGCSAILVDGISGTLVDTSSEFDLALLQAKLGDSKSVAVFSASPAMLNSDVTAVGFPYAGLLGGINVTRGSISSLKGLGGDSNTFQITAPVQSGNSGGPVLASDGEVVGVVVSKLDATLMAQKGGDVPQNVNFAIRGEIAKLFLAQNQVEAILSLDNVPLAPEQLAKSAANFTTFIECK